MPSSELEEHEYVRLIAFALKEPRFSVQQACEASGLSPRRFKSAMYSIFSLRGQHEHLESDHEILDWELSPEAYFNYLSFLEFRHSLATAAKAQSTANKAIFISIAGIIVGAALSLAALLNG